ncbi:MAG: cation-transporting P-type ATPase, partial [Chlorobiales bacterium]|nr:cation-transporting P-type ATPase [Chlorobiales bacterium]
MAQSQTWHSETAEQVFQLLSTSNKGLADSEIASRTARYGTNRLTPAKKQHPVVRFLLQFKNILIYVLLVAAVVTALLDHWIDAWVIFGVVIINALIGFIQEGKAEKALDAIKNLLSPQAMVRRNGRTSTVPSEQLVPGDIVILQSGDKVPADMRLFSARNLRIDES